MSKNEINCPACGAPVTIEPGKVRVICAFCGVSVAIPEEEQIKLPPPPPPPPVKTEDEVAKVLREAQPVARTALRGYAWWTILKRFIPTCLGILFLLCIAGCVLGGVLIYWAQNRF